MYHHSNLNFHTNQKRKINNLINIYVTCDAIILNNLMLHIHAIFVFEFYQMTNLTHLLLGR